MILSDTCVPETDGQEVGSHLQSLFGEGLNPIRNTLMSPLTKNSSRIQVHIIVAQINSSH